MIQSMITQFVNKLRDKILTAWLKSQLDMTNGSGEQKKVTEIETDYH